VDWRFTLSTDFTQARRILESLRQDFIAHIPQRLAVIEQCWINACLAQNAVTSLHELMRLTHSLHGSALTYGLLSLGEAAGRLENALAPWVERNRIPEGDDRSHLDSLMAAMQTTSRDVMGTYDHTVEAPAVERGIAPRVFLLEDDPDQASVLSAQLEHFGYRTRTFASPSALLDELVHERPDVCILDIIVGDHAQAGLELGMQLSRLDADLPVIFVSVRNDIDARLGAVKAGGRAYLAKPVDVNRLVEAVDQVIGRVEQTPYRVLIVEDDESLARYYQVLLQDHGMESMAISDPLEVLQAVAEFSPDLVLMDVYMPHCTGAELAQVIRQHGAHVGLPIVFLSTELDPDIQYAALRTGGDEFLTKPVDPRVLVRTVTLRVQRARLMGTLMVRDSLTGLLNHGRIKEVLMAEVARARRVNSTLTVVMLDLDNFKSINDRYGHMTGDRVLKSLARLLSERLRLGDFAGRYGGEEFLLLLPDCTRESALHLVDNIRSRFASIVYQGESPDQTFNATFSAGLATLPPDTHAEELLQKADAALYDAKQQGRNCTR
jgi:diguanylate cyclase (GGDEF)-like protein